MDGAEAVIASMVTSGAAARTVARINGALIPFYGEGAKGMYRSTQRSAPPGTSRARSLCTRTG